MEAKTSCLGAMGGAGRGDTVSGQAGTRLGVVDWRGGARKFRLEDRQPGDDFTGEAKRGSGKIWISNSSSIHRALECESLVYWRGSSVL